MTYPPKHPNALSELLLEMQKKGNTDTNRIPNQLFAYLTERLQKEAATINCEFVGWQERVDNYPLPLFTDNLTKTTKTVDIGVLILSEMNKQLKLVRFEYMKHKGA